MGKRNSKGGSKKGKSKRSRAKSNESNSSKRQAKSHDEYISENIAEQNENSDEGILENIDTNATESTSKTSSDTGSETSTTDTDINDYCEEIKAKQQELFDKLKNLSEAIAGITLIRDNVNSIRVDTLTELYFTRQVRPLLDALNIISFASYNMSYTATTFQSNAFGDRNEIKKSLKLSYKMNDEVDDIINVVRRRLAIFLSQINNMDKNCPPFDFNKDS
jgi:hypothetical protein